MAQMTQRSRRNTVLATCACVTTLATGVAIPAQADPTSTATAATTATTATVAPSEPVSRGTQAAADANGDTSTSATATGTDTVAAFAEALTAFGGAYAQAHDAVREAQGVRDGAQGALDAGAVDADELFDIEAGATPEDYMHAVRATAIDGVREDGTRLEPKYYRAPMSLSPMMVSPEVAAGAEVPQRATWQIDMSKLEAGKKALAADGSYVVLLQLPAGTDVRTLSIMRGNTPLAIGVSSLSDVVIVSFRASGSDVLTVSADIPAGSGFDTVLNAGVVPAQTPEVTAPAQSAQSQPTTTQQQPVTVTQTQTQTQTVTPTPTSAGAPAPQNPQPGPVVPGTLSQADVATLLASLGLTVDNQGRVVRVGSNQPVDWSNIAIGTPGIPSGQNNQNQMLQLMLAQMLAGQGQFTPVQSTTDAYLLQILSMLRQQQGTPGASGTPGVTGPVTVTVTPTPTTTATSTTSETSTTSTTSTTTSKSSTTSPTKFADILNDDEARSKLLLSVLTAMLTGSTANISTGDPTIDALIRSAGPLMNRPGTSSTGVNGTSAATTPGSAPSTNDATYGNGGKPVYDTCAAAAAKGESYMRAGTPGYHVNLDYDRNGVACDNVDVQAENRAASGGGNGSTGGYIDSNDSTGGSVGGSGGSGRRYDTCAEAAADGLSNMRAGTPGYDSSLDHDGDGVACEDTKASSSSAGGSGGYESDPYSEEMYYDEEYPEDDVAYLDSVDGSTQGFDNYVPEGETEYNEAADAFLPVTGISPFVWWMLGGATALLAVAALFAVLARREGA